METILNHLNDTNHLDGMLHSDEERLCLPFGSAPDALIWPQSEGHMGSIKDDKDLDNYLSVNTRPMIT